MNPKYTLVNCTDCGTEFPAKIYRKVIHVFPMVYKLFLRCPRCGKTYTSGYFDSNVHSMIDLGASREDIIRYQKGLEDKYGTPVHTQN